MILVSHLQLLKQWKFNTLASIKDLVNQLLKVQELNLLKMQEGNISSYWKRVGRRQVYLIAIFKKVFTQLVADIKNSVIVFLTWKCRSSGSGSVEYIFLQFKVFLL